MGLVSAQASGSLVNITSDILTLGAAFSNVLWSGVSTLNVQRASRLGLSLAYTSDAGATLGQVEFLVRWPVNGGPFSAAEVVRSGTLLVDDVLQMPAASAGAGVIQAISVVNPGGLEFLLIQAREVGDTANPGSFQVLIG